MSFYAEVIADLLQGNPSILNVVFRHNNPPALADSAGDMYEIIIAVFNGKGNSFLLLCVALCSFIVLIIVIKKWFNTKDGNAGMLVNSNYIMEPNFSPRHERL